MAKSNEITVVISSRKSGDEMSDFINTIKKTVGCQCKVIFVTNEGQVGLAELYANMLENQTIESDIIVFIHDDCTPLKSGWGKEVLRLFNTHKEYGIIGVAGSDEFGNQSSRGQAAWWRYEGSTYGQVLHRHDGKTWLTAFSPLLDHDLEEVCVIDGLFIAVNRRRIKKNFDKGLDGFNYYDIDFCLANYLEGVKIGVTTNIRLMHDSVGALSENWYKQREFICEKYKDKLPIKIQKKKLNA